MTFCIPRALKYVEGLIVGPSLNIYEPSWNIYGRIYGPSLSIYGPSLKMVVWGWVTLHIPLALRMVRTPLALNFQRGHHPISRLSPSD